MKDKTQNHRKPILIAATITFVLGAVILLGLSTLQKTTAGEYKTEDISIKNAGFEILADGIVTTQNKVDLHFQTGGKLTYLPLKEGDRVYQGQTIAALDTYALQRQLQIAANTYQISKNGNDQTQENNQAGVVEGQQRLSLDTTNKNTYPNITEAKIVSDAVARIVDNNALSQNTAQMNVDLANYAIQLATLTAPFPGILTHEDVTSPSINVTSQTTFTLQDPDTTVFRANISQNDIDFVDIGAHAIIKLGGNSKTYNGIIIKIYPTKMTLADGSKVYQVDIQSDNIKAGAKLDQAGSVVIKSNTRTHVMLVPSWLILGNQYVWTLVNNAPILKKVNIGKSHGNLIEVSGLSDSDKLILNPNVIASKKYTIL